jgi:hypothetical protein
MQVELLRRQLDVAHVFLAVLIHSQMDSSERASSNFVLDNVLIDMVLSLAIFFIIHVLGSRIQCFLHRSMLRGTTAVMSKRALVGWRRSRTNQYQSSDQRKKDMEPTDA